LLGLASAGQPKVSPEILQIKNVYILPMSNGFDQYLANQLTRDGTLQVVTDPSKADAVITDKLGKAFETAMEELYPSPKPEVPKKEEEVKDQASDSTSLDMKQVGEQRIQGSGRAKWTVFLVHRGSRNVVWSHWDQPRDVRPETLNRTAGRVAERLSQALRAAGASLR
jgi:hypothetical protein